MNGSSLIRFCHQRLSFSLLFFLMAGCLLTATILGTFLLPKTYASTARLQIAFPKDRYDPYFVQTTFEKIKSRRVMDQVVEELDLTRNLGERQREGDYQFSSSEGHHALLSMIDLRQSRNTGMLELRVFSDDPKMSAEIANKITEVAGRLEVSEVVDLAVANSRPIRPNVPLNLVIGGSLSVVIGLIFAAAGRLILRGMTGRRQMVS